MRGGGGEGTTSDFDVHLWVVREHRSHVEMIGSILAYEILYN